MVDEIDAGNENKITVYIDSDLEDLIPDYLESKKNDSKLFLQCIKENNFDKIKTEGHKMKGEGRGYGFDLISDVGSALESLAQDKNIEGIKTQLDKLLKYITSLNIVYQEMD